MCAPAVAALLVAACSGAGPGEDPPQPPQATQQRVEEAEATPLPAPEESAADGGLSPAALWFGDSDWYCCEDESRCPAWVCGPGTVATTDGLHTCCSPDIGQCPER